MTETVVLQWPPLRWQQGKGLGKAEDGISTAIVHKQTVRNSCSPLPKIHPLTHPLTPPQSTGMGTIRSLSPPPANNSYVKGEGG